MGKRWQVEVEVKDILVSGKCPAGYKVGDVFVSRGGGPPDGLCWLAANAISPIVTALAWGGNFPWHDRPGWARACCPDADNPVIFEIRRGKETEPK
ncbi:MAG: TIGR04076 family protein [Bacillota bacterium]